MGVEYIKYREEGKENGFMVDKIPILKDNKFIKCKNKKCPYHDKGNYCSSPSIVEIGEGGECIPYGIWELYQFPIE